LTLAVDPTLHPWSSAVLWKPRQGSMANARRLRGTTTGRCGEKGGALRTVPGVNGQSCLPPCTNDSASCAGRRNATACRDDTSAHQASDMFLPDLSQKSPAHGWCPTSMALGRKRRPCEQVCGGLVIHEPSVQRTNSPTAGMSPRGPVACAHPCHTQMLIHTPLPGNQKYRRGGNER